MAGSTTLNRTADGNSAEILIAGAGIIGLSLALELNRRGARVTVLERSEHDARIPGQASWAAAGMLAAEDPHNPAELLPLSRLSNSLYDSFLAHIAALSAVGVRYQTHKTFQYAGDGSPTLLEERSLDPRELLASLEAAVRAAGIGVRRGFDAIQTNENTSSVTITGASGENLSAAKIVFATGAWFAQQALDAHIEAKQSPVCPRKGQMLRVRLPQGFSLDEVHRAEDIYIVPRTHGAQAGSTLIGATVEDCGFDTTVDPAALNRLRARAAELVPQLASGRDAPLLEAWAGLRPGTPSGLPLLGALPGSERRFIACGHFRNGILLAPATAVVLADLLEGKPALIDPAPFTPPAANAPAT